MKVSLIIIWLWCVQAGKKKKKTVVTSLHQNQIRMFAQILYWQRKDDQLPKMCWTLVGIHHFPPSCLLQTFQPQQLGKDCLKCSTSEQAVSEKAHSASESPNQVCVALISVKVNWQLCPICCLVFVSCRKRQREKKKKKTEGGHVASKLYFQLL